MGTLRQFLLSNTSVFEILTIATFSILLIWYAQYYWSRRRVYELASKVPGPTGYPIIGMAHKLLNGPSGFLDTISEGSSKYHLPLFKAWFGPQLIYGVNKPEYLEQILKNNVDRGELFRKFLKPIVGNGLVSATVHQWKKNRRIINPALNQTSLNPFFKSFADNGDILVDQLKPHVNKKNWDINPLLVACMTDIVAETIFGVTLNVQKTGRIELAEWFDGLFTSYFTRTCNLFYHYDFIFDKTNLAKKMRFCISKLHNFTSKAIEEHRKKIENDAETYETDSSMDGRTNIKKPLLHLLMELSDEGVRFTNEELKDEINTLAIAGSDTVSTTLSFFFMALGIYQDVQQKMYEEIMEVIGDRQIIIEDLPNLKYLDKAIKEALRLFPAIPLTSRVITEEINLGEHTLAVGGFVILSFIDTHRSEMYWKNPLVFDPDRFSPEETAKRHPYSYLPFSGGPRNCIGFRFALTAMKTLTAILVREYIFKTPHKRIEDIKVRTVGALRPTDGYKVIVEKRT